MDDLTPDLEPLDEDDLPTYEAFSVRHPDHDPERSLGHLGVAWMEHMLVRGFGDAMGQRVELDQATYDLIVDAYALGFTGKRLYTQVCYVLPKGVGKTEIGGFVGLFEALGPARFAGFAKGGETFRQGTFEYTYEAGEPMGRRITAPQIRMMAVSEEQTSEFYRAVIGFNLDPSSGSKVALLGVAQGLDTFARLEDGGRIEPVTTGAASKDGGKETFLIADEAHLYVTPQLKGAHATMQRNLQKRAVAEPWEMHLSTMYASNQDSVLERLHNEAKDITEGRAPNEGLLWESRHAGVITDLTNRRRLRAVLAGVYADRDYIDLDRLVTYAQKSDPVEFRRYFLNTEGTSATAFFSHVEIASLVSRQVDPLKKGDTVVMGFDYAPGHKGFGVADGQRAKKLRIPDSTGIVAIRISDLSIHRVGLWEAPPSAKTEPWNPPMHEIRATLFDAFNTYNVLGMYADPTGVEHLLDELTAKYRQKLKVMVTGAKPMYRWMSGMAAASFAPVLHAFYNAVAGTINDDGTLEPGVLRMVPDPRLMAHFAAARRVDNRGSGLQVHKENPDSEKKIDLLVCAALAYDAARAAQNKGIGAERKRRRGFGNLV